MHKTLQFAALALFLMSGAVEAADVPTAVKQGASVRAAPDMAPNPNRAPRAPVMAQTIDAIKDIVPGPKSGDMISGTAEAMDGELLRLNDTVVRLFGIVPPQLSASYGPQARAQLDRMVKGQVTGCVVRDRDREGRLLASCATTQTADLALAMIQQGLAVVARGTVRNSDLGRAYAEAEQQAQQQGLGLWSSMGDEGAEPEVTAASSPQPAAVPKLASSLFPSLEAKTAQQSARPMIVAGESMKLASPEQAAEQPSVAPSVPSQRQADSAEEQDTMPVQIPTTTQKQEVQRIAPARDGSWVLPVALLFFYIVASTLFQIWQGLERERRERRAVAAALRGELAAARAICLTRADALAQDIMSGRSVVQMTWPRIRSTVYQAHVERIGTLGADLSRKVASLYGQLSDYAAYFGAHAVPGAGVRADATGTRQVLLTLISYIDVTTESLLETERTGLPARPRAMTMPTSLQDQSFENSMGMEQMAQVTQQTQPQSVPGQNGGYVTADGAQVTPLRRPNA